MSPFAVFIIILVVIWTLSGIATAINKQKEQERRRQLRMQMERQAAQQRGAPAPPPLPVRLPPQQISEGIAARFPDVLLPPAVQRPMRQAPPPPRPVSPRGQKVKSRGKKARQPSVEPIPTLEADETVHNLVTPAPPLAPVRQVSPGVQAPAISRWLKPETLRQQFILTEIFQPPLALRSRDNR